MKCPICEAQAKITKWRPPAGMDAKLREYVCQDGKHRFYAPRGRGAL